MNCLMNTRGSELRDFLRCGNLPTLISSLLYFDVSFMIWVMLGALGNYIASDFGLSPAEKGLMTALPLLSGSVMRLVLGMLADQIGGRRAGLTGLTLSLAPLLLGWLFAGAFPQVLLLGLLLGVAGASFAVALPLASRWYPSRHQGLAMGIAGAGNSGTVIAALLAPRLAEALGWHAVFGLALAPLSLVLAVFYLLAKDSPNQAPKQTLGSYFSALRKADTLLFCLFYGVTFGGFVGLTSFLSILFHDEFGISKVRAGELAAAVAVSGSLARPIGGYLSDRFGGVAVLTPIYLSAGALLFLVSDLPAIPVTFALLVMIGATLGMGNGSVFQLISQRFHREMGGITGITGAAGGIGGFAFPFLLGFSKDITGSYGGGFLLFGALAMACSYLLVTALRGWQVGWTPAPREEMRLEEVNNA